MPAASPITTLSLVIPVFNEAENLPELLRRCAAVCDALALDAELVLVDDGSRDGSAAILAQAARVPASRVVAVLLNRNYGQHAAIMAGFAQCRGDLVVTLDADLQNPPEEISRLVAAAQTHDVVGTVRRDRQDAWARRFASRLVNLAVERATGVPMRDYGCMLRAYRRPVVDAMLQCREHSTFIPILANGFARDATEIEVAHARRAHGASKYGFWDLVNLLFDLLTSMTTAPLRLLSLAGGAIAVLGFVLALALLVARLALGAAWAGDGVFTLFAVLFGFIGAQFVAMGLLGEYIGRTYTDVRARPRYFIQEVIRNSDIEPGNAKESP